MQGLFDRLSQDIRAGMRSLLKYPVSCAVAVISLAGGIGATTATLTIRDVVFRRPPALYRDPGRLSKVQVGSPEHPIRAVGSPVPGALYAIWRADLGETLAAAAPEQVREVRTDDRREDVRIRRVTPNIFATLGVDPALGRTFSGSVTSRQAFLSYRVWRFLLNGRSDVVGTQIWIGSEPYTVAGVMPERFWFSSMNSPIWIPLDAAEAQAERGVEVVVRRALAETHSQLAQRLQPGLSKHVAGLPAADRQQSLKVSGLEGTPAGNSMPLALPWLLATAVLLTVLIACANVAILVIAQWTAREHEIAIRASLGASRGRIVRALVTESILLAAIGGAFGILATLALRGLIVRNAGPAIAFFDLSLDPRVLIEAVGITLLAGVAAGIGPALFETRRLHGNPMRAIASADHLRQRWRHALVLLEIAVTVALLVVTGGMLNTYSKNYRTDIGYSTHPLILLRVENEKGVPVARLRDHLTRLPGVANAAPSTSMPFFSGAPTMQRVSTERTGARTERAELGAIGPDFFATLGVSMRAGRAFTNQDSPATRTAIVNELLASRLWGTGPRTRDSGDLSPVSVVGQTLWIGDTSYEIVGVVANYKNAALQPAERDAKAFVPIDAAARPTQMTVLIRAAADAAATERTIRRDTPAVAAGTAVAGSVTLDGIIDISGQEILVGTAPLAPLIATGLLLTAAGIYGVLAFAIARRSKELAVRIAIGASGRQVVRLVATESVRLTIAGTLCGIGATFALSRVVRALGGSGSFLDPEWTAFAVPVVILAVIGAVATWVPSRRALRIDPAQLLRAN
jgi:putative ABC transport system permease protein